MKEKEWDADYDAIVLGFGGDLLWTKVLGMW